MWNVVFGGGGVGPGVLPTVGGGASHISKGFHSPFNFKQVSLPVSNFTLPTTTDALWLEGKLSVCLIAQSCLTLCDPVDYSPPGSSVHGDSPGKNPGIKKAPSLRRFRMTGAIWNRSFPPQVYGSWANRELASQTGSEFQPQLAN